MFTATNPLKQVAPETVSRAANVSPKPVPRSGLQLAQQTSVSIGMSSSHHRHALGDCGGIDIELRLPGAPGVSAGVTACGHSDNVTARPRRRAHPVMTEDRMSQFLQQIDDASFESDRMAVIQTAARGWMFTSEQVGRVIEQLSFSDEQLEALRYLAPNIVDFENHYTIISKFSFSSDREEAAEILNR